jgi:GNAT superfamily N-acetyltransferase
MDLQRDNARRSRPAVRKLRRWWRLGGEVFRREGPGRLLVRSATAVRGLVYRDVILVSLDVTHDVPDVEPRVPVETRLLGPDELEAYARFRAQPVEHAQTRRRLEKGDACIAAWLDGEIVSAAWYSFGTAWVDDIGRALRLAPGEVFGYDLYTAESQRGRGVASERGRWAAAYFRAEGYRSVVAGLSPQNLPVQGPAQKLGYDTLGRAGFLRLGPLRRDFVRPAGGTRRWGRRSEPIETARDFGRAGAALGPLESSP